MVIRNHRQTLEDHDVVMHSHSNELGAIRLDLRMAVGQVEAQKEMILRLEDVNKHLEEEQDRLREGLQEVMAQIGWLCTRVVIPREVLDDLSDDSKVSACAGR